MNRPRPPRDPERGGILPLLVGMLLVLAVAFFGATTIGRYVIARQEAQRAADATCLALAGIIRTEGLQVIAEQETRAESVGRANSSLPMRFDWSTPPRETPGTVELACRAIVSVPAPSFVFRSASLDASGVASAVAKQQTITDATKSYPQVVLVLDFSGSMQQNFQGQMTPDHADDSINNLVHAAKLLLDKDYELRYGMVIFSGTNLYSTPDVKLGNGAIMKDKVDANAYPCPYPTGNNSCSTNSAGALSRAHDLLKSPSLPADEKKYIIFVSDGAPNSTQAARAQATRLWDLGVNMYTLQIVNSPASGTTLRQFMISISGPPNARGQEVVGNRRYYYNASDETTLEQFFTGLGGALACSIGPLDPAPANPSKLHVFVRDGSGRDVVVQNAALAPNPATEIGDLWSLAFPFHDGNWFLYAADERMVYVTPSVCDRVQKQDQNVIIRFNSAVLTQ